MGRIEKSNHNNEEGIYNVHFYEESVSSGAMKFLTGISFTW